VAQDLGISGFGTREIPVQGLNDKELAIPRVDQSRRSSGGHVAEDPGESGFGGIGVSRVVKRLHSESRSAIPRVNLGR
jgi:hypothetical protein